MRPRITITMTAATVALALPLGLMALVPAGAAGATMPRAGTSAARTSLATQDAADDRTAAAALRRLRDDADGAVRVHRDDDGRVDLVRSADGEAMVARAGRTPAASAAAQLARYGAAFGIDGASSRAVVTETIPSAIGSVVRAEQRVDGVPVFGGGLVLSLDKAGGVVSVDASTTTETSVPAAEVSRSRARATALALAAKAHGVAASSLRAEDLGRQVFDPSLLHVSDPGGTRPVWAWRVSDGTRVRETVLVGTGRGEVALHFNDAPQLGRAVCDNADAALVSSSGTVPACTSPVRREGDQASGVADVDQAYDNLGATATAYADLGVDLASLIGGTSRTLSATVRWCFTDETCPLGNAFWDGSQMVFGRGYAAADDVVGHELTHGYVERTSALFYFHQSGAINESLADVLGEVVDHRNPASPADDSDWQVGEDLPGGQVRSLADPTTSGQPDRMTSSLYKADDFTGDAGDVHDNDGVGNKTAYLISQGGTFNGHVVSGIDAGDPMLTKTGTLYVETIPRLTSGAEYADLGHVLVATCEQLAAAGEAGFVAADCASAREAVAATELEQQPTVAGAAAPEVAVACPTGSVVTGSTRRDDDGVDGFDWTFGSLWGRLPTAQIPSYAVSGTQSLLGLDPAPEYGDPSSSSLTSASFVVPAAASGSYLNFHHAYIFEFGRGTYYDGGQVVVSKLVNGAWTPVTDLPWVNGPTRHFVGNTAAGSTGFAGDSHGYGSSQLDLSSLAGQTVRVAFRVVGDSTGSFYGWWVDDVRLYSCGSAVPGAPVLGAQSGAVSAAGRSTATVAWQPPAYVGSGVSGYRVTRSDTGAAVTLPASARSLSLAGFSTTSPLAVSVAALNAAGTVGPATTARFTPTTTSVTSSTTGAKANRAFTVTTRVTRRGSSAVVRGMRVVLQRKVLGTSAWRTLSSGVTGAAGTKAWSVKQTASTYYRVVSSPTTTWFTSTSASRLVRRR